MNHVYKEDSVAKRNGGLAVDRLKHALDNRIMAENQSNKPTAEEQVTYVQGYIQGFQHKSIEFKNSALA